MLEELETHDAVVGCAVGFDGRGAEGRRGLEDGVGAFGVEDFVDAFLRAWLVFFRCR